jgi:hypothetical protein
MPSPLRAISLALLLSCLSSSVHADPPPVEPGGHADKGWRFDYHGYFRAPLRVGIGRRTPADTGGYVTPGASETTLHEATVPDDQYLSFQSTAHNMRSWAEAFFTFGNSRVSGTVGIASYNLTEGGFNDADANWGISQAYLRFTPDLGFENLRLWAKAGALVDKYGMSGRYDAGEYDTYVFGRTHVIGETAHLEYDLAPSVTLHFEQGFGGKKPDPNQHNNARFTLLHHEHLGVELGSDLEIGLHYLNAFSQEEFRPPGNRVSPDRFLAPRNGLPDGSLWVAGIEARAELGAFGYLYGSFSHVGAEYALTVSRAIEVLHASGGGEFDLGIVGNYLDSPNCADVTNPWAPAVPIDAPPGWQALDPNACSDGNGSVNAFHAQYEFSVTNFQNQLAGGERFHGHGFDVVTKLYGMLALVDSEARDTTRVPPGGDLATESPEGYSITKLKYGADVSVQILPFLSTAVRFDRVEPNDQLPEQSFAVLSPRVTFKTEWVSHERFTLGYSRYFYDQRVCRPAHIPRGGTVEETVRNPRCTQPPPSAVPYDGFGSNVDKQEAETRASGVMRPDLNVFKVEATMWW